MLMSILLVALIGLPQLPADGLLAQLKAADAAAARRLVKSDPAATSRALDALLARVDASVHSDRQRPEQRRVTFDAEGLDLGVRIGGLFGDVTGDRSYYKRFRARQQRLDGTVLLNGRRYREALVPLKRALTESRILEDRWLEVITRINLAYAYLELGQGEQALAECGAAAHASKGLDDRARALASFNLGSAYLHLGEAKASLQHSQEALALSRRAGIRLWQGNSLINIGAAQQLLGNLDAAGEAFDAALAIFESTSDRLGTGRALYNLGLIAFGRRELDRTVNLLERALPHIRSVDIRHSHEIELDPQQYQNPIEMSALQVLIAAYQRLGEDEKAAAHMAALKKLRSTQRPGTHIHRSPNR